MDLRGIRLDIEKKIKPLGYQLYDIEYVKERQQTILRVIIDKPSGIDIDDCVAASEVISVYLDDTDPISDNYSLEVTSPGAEKKLRNREEIVQAIGRYVFVKTNEQEVMGELVGFEEDTLSLKTRQKIIDINYLNVTLIRLAIKL